MEFKTLIADQQAASVAEGALYPEVVKVTLGIGLFIDIPRASYPEVEGFIPLVLYKVSNKVGYGF